MKCPWLGNSPGFNHSPINKVIRSTSKLEGEARIKAVAEKGQISEALAKSLLTPKYGRVGFPGYSLTNNNANIRRIKERIKTLEADLLRIAAQGEKAETRYDDLGVTVIENNVENRIQLDFDRRLTKPAYRIVKGESFNKTKAGIFQRKLNHAGGNAVARVLAELRKLDEVLVPAPVPVVKPEIDPTLPKSCGYCGHKYPHDTDLTFCDRCIGSPYLTPDTYHLLRLMPGDWFQQNRPKLSSAEQAELTPDILAAQAKTISAIQQQKADEKRKRADEKRKRVEKDYQKSITSAQTKYDGFIWLLDHGINTENCIFYSHTLTFCFGWQSPISAEVKNQLEQDLQDFKFSVEYKCC